jgi:class 3 adenylate cyclase
VQLEGGETCPLPADRALAEAATALNASGSWGFVTDERWRIVYMTDDIRLSNGGLTELVPVPREAMWFAPEAIEVMLSWRGGVFSLESWRASLRALVPWVLEDLRLDVDELRQLVDPRLRDALDHAEPAGPETARTYSIPGVYSTAGAAVDIVITAIRLRGPDGRVAGTAFSSKPAAGMAVLGSIAAAGDLRHFARMQRLAGAARRPAAILFGDLESSSALSRRLSTSSYFALGRRLVRAADRAVVDAGGVVGRHAGDGVVAIFLAEDTGSESAAAAACIGAARALRLALRDVGVSSGLHPDAVTMRFGLHWGATLHVGQITTPARAEVNALGDEMNEAARIEACAGGGRALASKALIERLDRADAAGLGLDLGEMTYVALAELDSATEKARRDAPNLAVCDV